MKLAVGYHFGTPTFLPGAEGACRELRDHALARRLCFRCPFRLGVGSSRAALTAEALGGEPEGILVHCTPNILADK